MSLRLRAVLIAGLSLVLLWGVAAGWMMRGVHANLDRALDGRLAMSARMVSGLLERAALAPSSPAPNLSDVVSIQGREGIACEIRSLRGEVLARTTSGPHSEFEALPAGFSTREVQGDAWRVYVLRANGYQVTTADRIGQRHELTQDLLSAAGVPFVIALFGGLLALWVGIGRGLAPMKAVCEQMRAKQTDDTTPIAVDRAPSEMRPMLNAMNGLLGRLAHALNSQRAFTDAAAHELRTPLTVIDTHLQVARMSEGEEARASLASAEEGVRRLRRTLEQMMVLARTDASVDEEDRCTSVLGVIDGVLAHVGRGAVGRVHLSTEGADAATPVPCSMLEAALRNLVDNALRYSPETEVVEVLVHLDHASAQGTISVADRGPGLSAAQAAQIGRRFWRGDQGRQRQDGAGLGISIVQGIAQRFGGTLELQAREGGGLQARFGFALQGAR